MPSATIHLTTQVLPGKRIELSAPEWEEGETIEVFLVRSNPHTESLPPRRSALEVIEALQGHRLFSSPEAVDTHLNAERDTWER